MCNHGGGEKFVTQCGSERSDLLDVFLLSTTERVNYDQVLKTVNKNRAGKEEVRCA